jgi:hypothetical protein
MARKVAVRNGADAAKPDATRSTRRAARFSGLFLFVANCKERSHGNERKATRPKEGGPFLSAGSVV